MYYTPWCPRCEKPEIEMIPTLNLLQVLYHLEAIGYINAKKILWEYFSEVSCFNNDSYFSFSFEDIEEELHDELDYEDEDSKRIEALKLLIILKEVFNIEKSITFFVSW
ncbi:MAG: hypothetical protein PHC28_10270 [Flavobacterium sp.]|uniref:hypothetical protein n=1 Tax=Flavobacterium sp. TaxID=239 RepID=UPI00261AAD03|nr:hypothetical protein [Flavobacterium sp.]MDD5150842.1 hypothetical protein [Flavobacterium sp.]